jgi:hypothetical protein
MMAVDMVRMVVPGHGKHARNVVRAQPSVNAGTKCAWRPTAKRRWVVCNQILL